MTVQGVVIDAATNEPVVGAQVWIKDSSYGTITDADGRYSIKYSGTYAVLCASFFGYEDTQIKLTGNDQKENIVMKEGALAIEETVVVGYGTQKKASVIGAITTVMADQLQAPVANISNVIGGQVSYLFRIMVSRVQPLLSGSAVYHPSRVPLLLSVSLTVSSVLWTSLTLTISRNSQSSRMHRQQQSMVCAVRTV